MFIDKILAFFGLVRASVHVKQVAEHKERIDHHLARVEFFKGLIAKNFQATKEVTPVTAPSNE